MQAAKAFLLSFSFLLMEATTAAADDPTFRSEVSLSRVDARVLDRDGHAVTGLSARDFILRLGDREIPVKNFANENTPIDILLLLDVSGSMEPHVERIALAARQALNVLGEQDRVGIMVFDSRTRVRLPFRNNRSDVTRELNRLLDAESFNGATRVTSAMLDAAKYIQREARADARRAIVILTDDMTQDRADEGRVETALRNARAIMSFLRAPYEEPSGFGTPGPVPGGGRRGGSGPWGTGGSGWPGGGGGWPGGGGGGWPGGGPGGGNIPISSPSHSAGTETVALESGGDAMDVNEAAALEDTLSRLRQRYALYFYLPEELAGQGGAVRVSLAETAAIHYHGAEIQARRVFMASDAANGSRASEPATVTRVSMPSSAPLPEKAPERVGSSATGPEPSPRRGRAVNENSGPKVNSVGSEGEETQSANAPAPVKSEGEKKGGWPKASERQKPPE